jgi:hypothetical protein
MCPHPPPPLLVDPLSLEASDHDNNQLATEASKAGGVWQESIDDHLTMTAGNDKGREHAADDDGSNKEGKGGKGNGDCNNGDRRQRE